MACKSPFVLSIVTNVVLSIVTNEPNIKAPGSVTCHIYAPIYQWNTDEHGL